MTTGMKKSLAILFSFLLTATMSACGTTKNFTIDSSPKGALISSQVKIGSGLNISVSYGETPTKANLTFYSDDARYSLTAEKRGYDPSTLVVSQNSNETVVFDLRKIDGVSEAVFKKGDLPSGSYTLLPAQVEVIIHSGVGAIDEKTHSPEVSKKVTEELNAELAKSLDGNGS